MIFLYFVIGFIFSVGLLVVMCDVLGLFKLDMSFFTKKVRTIVGTIMGSIAVILMI